MTATSTVPTRTPAREHRSFSVPPRLTTLMFGVTAFFGAGMLFLVQPMIARMLLPSYGGAATVWSTSSLFFQVVLLLGYVYTDRSSRLGSRRQRMLHCVVLLLPLLVLPLVLPSDAAPPAGMSPVLWLLRTLAVVVGVPFLVLATTGPLLQKRYSWLGLARSSDPYFLFAASNLGSFVGLLAYPFLIEPFFSLDQQERLWSIGFVVFIALTGCCLLLPGARRPTEMAATGAAVAANDPESEELDSERVPVARVVSWTALAFLSSALMLAVTSHITTDIAAIPLLWVLPLGIYLASFVGAFARHSRQPPVLVTRIAVLLAAIASFSALVGVAHQPVWLAIAIQMVMLALVAFAAHARLAADRPRPARLTTFYLVVAVGGALGGLLNGVIAPLLFDRVLEYPLLIVTVPLLMLGLDRDGRSSEEGRRRRRVRLLTVAVLLLLPAAGLAVAVHGAPTASLLLALAGCSVLVWSLTPSPRLLCAVLVASQLVLLVSSDVGVIDRRRTFYGSLSVKATADQHLLYDGTTLHGTQFLNSQSSDPTSYYARSGPLGDVFQSRRFRDVAVVGLGAGTVAAYGEPGQAITFFEINPAVVSVARDPQLFTYLTDSPADVNVVTGDGRLGLQSTPEVSEDLIILDAFSSDSIPVHLLTQEAVQMYAARLRPGGLLAFHISNNIFDLQPVLRADADALGWEGVVGRGGASDAEGATPSTWVVLAPTAEDLRGLDSRPGWSPLPARSVAWSDDYSSVLHVLR
jgi:SAM-dependent methyltransferase